MSNVWDKIKGTVSAVAPALGAALGGPAGGLIGTAIAGALGVEATPDAVEQALRIDPNAAIKLREIESNEKVALATLTSNERVKEVEAGSADLSTVNATMQTEAQSAKWWVSGWRPYWGFISGSAFFVVACFTCLLAYKAIVEKDTTAMTMIPQFVTAMAVLFGIPGTILGIASWHRGMAQRGQ